MKIVTLVFMMMQGLGITMFGMAYMFVHDGLVHRRFPVGPIADVPYLQKVAAAHQVCCLDTISNPSRRIALHVLEC